MHSCQQRNFTPEDKQKVVATTPSPRGIWARGVMEREMYKDGPKIRHASFMQAA